MRWLGVVNFHCMQMSLVMSMWFIFGDDWNDMLCKSLFRYLAMTWVFFFWATCVIIKNSFSKDNFSAQKRKYQSDPIRSGVRSDPSDPIDPGMVLLTAFSGQYPKQATKQVKTSFSVAPYFYFERLIQRGGGGGKSRYFVFSVLISTSKFPPK